MSKKFFAATILIGIIFFAAQINICGATLAPYQMYLGGLTYDSSIEEMKEIYGEPDAVYSGGGNYATCTYGDGVLIRYQRSIGKIQGITITKKNNWTAVGEISVGDTIKEWLSSHESADKVKSGDDKTVYAYFHYKTDAVSKKNVRDFGLFIAFNKRGGKITELRIEGDKEVVPFEKIYEDIMSDMLAPIKK